MLLIIRLFNPNYKKLNQMFKKITLLSALAFSLTNANATETNPLENATVANDVKVEEVQVNRFTMYNVNNPVSIKVKNVGNNPVKSLTFNWNDGENHVARVTTNIAVGATAIVKHPVGAKYANLVEQTINVRVSMVNDLPDGNPANNSGNAKINTVSKAAGKKVVVEEGTGTWCGWCVRGIVGMKYMEDNYANQQFIGIAVHQGDPMAMNTYINGLGFQGYPSSKLDRAIDADPSAQELEQKYNQRKSLTVPAGMAVEVSGTGNNITIKAKATFNTNISSANYRLGVIVIENGITGTGSGWGQANYYAGGGSGQMGGYENKPATVNDQIYDHVAKALLGTFNGQAGSVPTSVTNGQEVTYDFSYTIPSGSNKTKMYAIAVLIDQANKQIVNAEKINIDKALTVADTLVDQYSIKIFPNPTNEGKFYAKLNTPKSTNFSLTLSDISGRILYTKSYDALIGEQLLEVPVSDLSKGNYIISLATNRASYSKLIMVK